MFPRWNKTYSRLKCAFDDLTNKQKDTFLLEGKYNDRCGFSIINFKDIPIMPNGLEDAEKWRNWHINKEIEQHYYLENDFNTLINKTNNKEAFEAYKKRLTEPTIHQYRSELRQDGRNKQTKSYWHLVAANDLNPAETYKVIEKSLNYKIGQNISFEEITNQLKSNTQHAINCVYYYDKYTNSKEQQQKMKAFFDAFDCKVKILITQKGKTRDKYLQENVPEIITKDVKVVFLKDKPQHNRYIILSESNKKYTIWQLPSSIDFIKFYQTEDVTSSSKGRIVDSMSYHQVAKEMLKPDLITFIER